MSAVLIEFALELGVIWEIARIVMRPTGTWVRDARKQFILLGAAGILLAAALPWLITPPAASLMERLAVRGNLFTSLVICELIAVVTRTSKSLGLGWRNHVMALGNGWTAWAVIAILVDGLHSYFGAERYFQGLEHVQDVCLPDRPRILDSSVLAGGAGSSADFARIKQLHPSFAQAPKFGP